MPRKKEIKIAVIDAETDPFKHGRIPKPFAWGFFDGSQYVDFWGDTATDQLLDFLDLYPDPLVIFAHNGGKFDFYFLPVDNPVKIINGRIVKAGLGKHTLQDSYAILPEKLAKITGGKLEIDYSLFEPELRNAHREDILHYLAVDCEELYKAVAQFVAQFGLQLTIASTAYKELRKLYPLRGSQKSFDEKYRPFYFGGRCQAFETGELHGDFYYIDVNSLYPSVMKDRLHPTGTRYLLANGFKELDSAGRLVRYGKDRPYFALIRADNSGAFPCRIPEGPNKGGLDFTSRSGLYYVTSHELQVAIKHGLCKIHEIIELHIPYDCMNFAEYVDMCMAIKLEGEREGNKIKRTFGKLLANNGYGKFAQNPENYFDWHLCRSDEDAADFISENADYELFEKTGEVTLWRKPSQSDRYNNVATAASITGGSRAVLLDALAQVKRPVYCDTDSIICTDTGKLSLDPVAIGKWKLEARMDTFYIGGKKLYAGYHDGELVKLASKGVRLTGEDVKAIALGGSVEWANDVPSFRPGKQATEKDFIHRTIKMRKSR